MLNPFSVSEVDTFLTRYLRLLEAVCFLPGQHPGRAWLFHRADGLLQPAAAHGRLFRKQMPIGHEYIRPFAKARDDALGAKRLKIGPRRAAATPLDQAGLARPYEVTQAVMFAQRRPPRRAVAGGRPTLRLNEITEEGFRADPL